MPAPFQRLTLEQLAAALAAFDFRRRITAVHMHHTWRPNHAQWKGHDSMVGMWRFHTRERGFSDIAQHLTIDPEGMVWTGRNWNAAPASAIGHNGTGVAGPFMFETVGDFDLQRDRLEGAQRQAVLQVIALVQRRFGLPPEALLFHNQMSGKTCPGSGVDCDALLAELKAHIAAGAAQPAAPRPAARGRKLPLADSALADHAIVQRALSLIEPDARAARAAADQTPLEEIGCGDWAEHYLPSGSAEARGGGGTDAPLGPEQIAALRAHVVNLRMGRFSNDGLMTSSQADVRALVHEHLKRAADAAEAEQRTLRVLLFAHGGLVKESRGLAIAAHQVGWWLANGVYPIHFVWETGLFETFRGLLERARAPLGGPRGLDDWLTDHLSDPLIETTVRVLGAERVWGGMKAAARIASEPGGGARFFLEQLAAFCHGRPGREPQLHAAAHSAGSVFHAHLLDAARALGVPSFATLQLLAPALRIDQFATLTQPLLGNNQGVDALTVYTMLRDLERADDCGHLYRKSLLYLVRASAESERGTPLLGLEESLRDDAAMRALFGLGQAAGGPAEIVWSTSPLDDGRSASRATTHSGFDEDAPTMNSAARRVLGLADTDPLPKPFVAPAGSRAFGDSWVDTVDWPEELESLARQLRRNAQAAPAVALPAPGAAAAVAALAADGGGRRRALCVGIDAYARSPLAGCVNDARLWQQTLAALGFEVALLRNVEATRAGLMGALERMIAGALPGDELVFQFAGHGCQVDDLDGDERSGDTPGLDEALCPIDYDAGALLIDDDLGALIDRMPASARLTLFMDCCHSGTVARIGAPGARPPAGSDARARVLQLTAVERANYRARRATTDGTLDGADAGRGRRSRASRAAQFHPELLFTACRSHELAWEADGHGEFTLRATRLLAAAGAPAFTPRALHQQVLAAFGNGARQQPTLEGPAARLDALLFG